MGVEGLVEIFLIFFLNSSHFFLQFLNRFFSDDGGDDDGDEMVIEKMQKIINSYSIHYNLYLIQLNFYPLTHEEDGDGLQEDFDDEISEGASLDGEVLIIIGKL